MDRELRTRAAAFVDNWNTSIPSSAPLFLDDSLLSLDVVLHLLLNAPQGEVLHRGLRVYLEDLSFYIAFLLQNSLAHREREPIFYVRNNRVFFRSGSNEFPVATALEDYLDVVAKAKGEPTGFSGLSLISHGRASLLSLCGLSETNDSGKGAACDTSARIAVLLDEYCASCVRWFKRVAPTQRAAHQAELYRPTAYAAFVGDGVRLDETLGHTLCALRDMGLQSEEMLSLGRVWLLAANPTLALIGAMLILSIGRQEPLDEVTQVCSMTGVPTYVLRRLVIFARQELGTFEDWILDAPDTSRIARYERELSAGVLPRLLLPKELLLEQQNQSEIRQLYQAIVAGDAAHASKLCAYLRKQTSLARYTADFELQELYLRFVLGDKQQTAERVFRFSLSGCRKETRACYYEFRAQLEHANQRLKRAAHFYRKALEEASGQRTLQSRVAAAYAHILAELDNPRAAVQLFTYSSYLSGKPSMRAWYSLLCARILPWNTRFVERLLRSNPFNEILVSVQIERFIRSNYMQDESTPRVREAVLG